MQCGFQFGNKSINLLNNGILRVEKTWMYTDYDVFKDFVEKNLDANVVAVDNEKRKIYFILRAQKKGYEIDINEYRWVRMYRFYDAYIRITEKSLSYISDALPMLKKEYFSYLLFGMFYNSGCIDEEHIWFMTSFRAAKTLQKQLKNWYGIESNIIQPSDPKGSRFGCIKICSEEMMEKFVKILPYDYIEIFMKKWEKNKYFLHLLKKLVVNVKISINLVFKC